MILFLNMSYMGQGYVLDTMEAFLLTPKRIRSLGRLATGEDNSGAVVDEPPVWWKATYHVVKNKEKARLVVRITDSGGGVSISDFLITSAGLRPVGKVGERLLK